MRDTGCGRPPDVPSRESDPPQEEIDALNPGRDVSRLRPRFRAGASLTNRCSTRAARSRRSRAEARPRERHRRSLEVLRLVRGGLRELARGERKTHDAGSAGLRRSPLRSRTTGPPRSGKRWKVRFRYRDMSQRDPTATTRFSAGVMKARGESLNEWRRRALIVAPPVTGDSGRT